MSSSINTGTDITGLTPNTSYTFSCYPINANGQESTTESTVTFTTLPYITSSYFSSVDSENKIKVAWTGNAETVTVYYSTDQSTYTLAGSTSSSSTYNYQVTSLTPNTQYYFKLIPFNSASAAGLTNYISNTSAVTNGNIWSFSTSTVDTSSILLTYSGYFNSVYVTYGQSSGTATYNKTISGALSSTSSSLTATINGLSSGTTYYFKMYPYNSISVLGTAYTEQSATTSTSYAYLTTSNMSFAYSVRLLVSTYTGAVIKVRRSSDSVTQDFYTDSTQSYLTTGYGNTGTTYSTWIGSSTGYITIWYDQSGKGNNATNSTNGSTQPILIYNSTTGKYITSWNTSNSTKLTLGTSSQPNTVYCHFYPSSTYYCTLMGTAIDYSVRFGGSGNTIDGDGNADDWFYNSYYNNSSSNSGYTYCVNNSTSTKTFTSSQWTVISLSLPSPAWRSTSFSTLGYAYKDPASRSFSGYMVEMICHNTTMNTTNHQAFYSNRLFTNTSL